MIRFIVLPALSCLSLPYWPELMPAKMVLLSLFIAVILLLHRYTRLASCVLLGIIWTNYIATHYQSQVEHIFQNRGYITINGRVDSLISEKKLIQSFIFVTDPISLNSSRQKEKFRLRLFWKGAAENLSQGQRWQFNVKLKPVVSKLNGVGYDVERYYLSQHIHANATVKDASLLEDNPSIRQRFYCFIDEQLRQAGVAHRGFMLALSFAVRDFLSLEVKQQLKESGLLHLLAISGLHIGLAFVFSYWLGSRVSVIFNRADKYHSYVWILSLLGGIAYAWLAGFTLSSQRALIMGATGLWYRQKGVPLTSYQPWLFSFSLCLLYDPFAVFSVSLYLSYLAVLVLLLMGHFIFLKVKISGLPFSRWFVWLRSLMILVFLQLFLFIVMFPLQMTIFSGVAYLAPVFNLLMVPWVSLVCVPLIFLMLVLPIAPVLWLVDVSFSPLSYILRYAQDSWLTGYQMQQFLVDVVANELVVGAIIFSISFLLLRRYLVLCFSALLTCYLIIRPAMQHDNTWKMSVLDVGHGLSVVIERDKKAIIYDVGRAWEGGSIAESIVYPYLLKQNIEGIDNFILSHDDIDHAGNWSYLNREMPARWKRAPSKRRGFLSCIRGEKWRWKGLDFEVLWPLRLVKKAHNQDSCIIRISDPYHAVLLTGDIENIAEYQLLNLQPDIAADVAIIPHHGSKDSSNLKWTTSVHAQYAINSSAKMSRWNLPHPKVVDHYATQGSWVLDTADHGRIDLIFDDEDIVLKTAREDYFPFWYRHLLNN